MEKLRLEDFPTCVYFFLRDEFRKEFIRKCALVTGLNYKGLSQRLVVPYQTLLNWKAGRRAMPAQVLQKMVSLLREDPIVTSVNKNVTACKLKSGKLITNPNLPLIFDERAVTLLVHLMADGYVADRQMPSYCNYDPQVLEEIKNSLRMFGDVPIKKRDKKKGKELLIPTIVLKLMKEFFGKLQFGSHKARIPESIRFSPPSIAAAVIKAFADDEATVLARCVRFYSANCAFLNDIRSILIDKFSTRNLLHGISESSISQITISTGRSAFYFDITSKGLEAYQKLIGFTHSKKRSKLALWVSRVSTSNWHHYPQGATKEKILEELQKGPKTVKELSKATGIREGVISTYFLKVLSKEGFVMHAKRTGLRGNLWILNGNNTNTGYGSRFCNPTS